MVNGFKPKSLAEALQIRRDHSAVPYAGGTDLMIAGREDVCYLFLDSVSELRGIREDADCIRIGAAVTFTEVLGSPLIPAIMREAVGEIAAPAIRNLGTMGGNIGNGSAKADSVLIEFVCDAKLRIASADGERIVAIDKFYKGRKKLDLAPDELIVEILLPRTGLDDYYYKKVGARNALAISRVAFAAVIKMDGEVIRDIAVAFGAVSDTVLRFKAFENMLCGKTLSEAKELREAFIAEYDKAIVPTRGRVSSEYRKAVCLNLLRNFLTEKGI